MRKFNGLSHAAHDARIFQLEIFWPTLESIYDLRQSCLALDQEENDLLRCMIANRSLVDMNKLLDRQRQIASLRADKLAEVERKWALIHAGCQFIAMMLNAGRADPASQALTPETVYTTLVKGGGDIDSLLVLANG